MWIFKGGPSDKPVILFQYHPTRSGDVAAVFLKGYKGIVQTDGYGGYNFLDDKKDILHVGLWVHAHRKFYASYIKLKKRHGWKNYHRTKCTPKGNLQLD